jgi:PAS domain S-box-containing protein
MDVPYSIVTENLLGSIALSALLLLLYYNSRSKVLKCWAVAWLLYSAYLGGLILFRAQSTVFDWRLAIPLVLGVGFCSALICGAYEYNELKFPRRLKLLGLGVTGWLLISWTFLENTSLYLIPLSLFVSFSFLLTAYLIFQNEQTPKLNRYVVAFIYGGWAIHLLAFPFVYSDVVLLPWGYRISMLFSFLGVFALFSAYTGRVVSALSESESVLRQYVDNAPIAIVITDNDGYPVFVNKEVMKGSGYSFDDVKNKTLADFVIPSMREKAQRVLAEAKAGHVVDSELVMRTKHLGNREFFVRMTRISERLLASFNYDTTEKNHFERKAQRMRKLQSLQKLAGGIAHDFNNILSIVLGCAELAERKKEQNLDIEQEIKEIIEASLRAKGIIKQFSIINKQGFEERVELNLNTVVEKVVAREKEVFSGNIRFRMELSQQNTMVWISEESLSRIIKNLVQNSKTAMPNGGTITVATGQEEMPYGENDLKKGLFSYLRISDTGLGIDDEALKSIFDPYFSTRPLPEASGLGLAVVHGIVEAHQGSVIVETELGRGSEFTIYLPTPEFAKAMED